MMRQIVHNRNASLLFGASLVISCLMPPVTRANAQCSPSNCDVVQFLTAPGGKNNYYIMKYRGKDSFGNQKMAIEVGQNNNSSFEVLVKDHPSNNPEQNLTGFSNLFLSPNSKTLYFETDAWAVADAIHAVDLSTRKIRFITSGELKCVILGGEYQGDLIVEQHRYFVQGGSYDALYLFTPADKDLGLVSEDTDASKLCPTL